jgi:hypothetical protein
MTAVRPSRAPHRSARLLAAVWALFWVVAAFQPCAMAVGLGHGPASGEPALAGPAGTGMAEAPCLHCELPDFQPVAPVELPASGPAAAASAPAAVTPAAPALARAATGPPPRRTPTYLYLRVLRL